MIPDAPTMTVPLRTDEHGAIRISKMLNLELGLDVRWIPDAVDPVRHFERYGSNLVISCVDNPEARQAIHQINGVILGAITMRIPVKFVLVTVTTLSRCAAIWTGVMASIRICQKKA